MSTQGTGSNQWRVLSVSYDLQTPFKDYSSFFETLKQHSQTWCHYLVNTWLIKTTLTEGALARLLFPHMTTSDRLLILEIKGTGNGWMAKDVWEWLVENNGPGFHSIASLFDALTKPESPEPPSPLFLPPPK